MSVDTQITQLIQAMATYSSNYTGFEPTAIANPQITDLHCAFSCFKRFAYVDVIQ